MAKGDKRNRLDDLKTAYHVAQAVEQASWLRRNWDKAKEDMTDFLVHAGAAIVVLILGYFLSR